MIELPGHRIETPNKKKNGTGCTLSAALAALLPQCPDVPEAARRAKAYLTEAIRQADRLQVGSATGRCTISMLGGSAVRIGTMAC